MTARFLQIPAEYGQNTRIQCTQFSNNNQAISGPPGDFNAPPSCEMTE